MFENLREDFMTDVIGIVDGLLNNGAQNHQLLLCFPAGGRAVMSLHAGATALDEREPVPKIATVSSQRGLQTTSELSQHSHLAPAAAARLARQPLPTKH